MFGRTIGYCGQTKWGEVPVVLSVVEDWMRGKTQKRTKRPGKGKAPQIPRKRGPY